MPLKIGLALGGGGARGLAHVGILKVFEEEGIPVHCISGASVGAIVGAMYAQNPNVDAMVQRFKKTFDDGFFEQMGIKYVRKNNASEGSFLHQASRSIKKRIVINLAQSRQAILNEERFSKVLENLIDHSDIQDMKIPLAIVATSLITGDDIIFRTDDIITALKASSAIPGFLPPINLNGDLLTDGAVSCPVPIKTLHGMGADITIGVEICMRELPALISPNVIDIISHAEMITARNLAKYMTKAADVALFPDTKDIHWSEFSRFDELIEAGIQSARESMPEIKRVIRKKTPWLKGRGKIILSRFASYFRTPSDHS